MSFCVGVSFAAVYLQALGYTNGRLGVILALGSVMGIVTSIALSAWIDRSARVTARRLIPAILALQTAAVAALLLIPGRGLAVSVAFVAYIGFCTTVNALNLKLYADADHVGFRIDYGFTRGVGSVAYVLMSLALGVLTERVSYRAIPVLGLILCAVQFAAHARFARFVVEGRKVHMAAVVAYVKQTIDFRDSAKAQSLAFTTTTFGGMLASLIGGQLYDRLSVTSTLMVALAAGVVGAAIVFWATKGQYARRQEH